ncbi:hypothetical protein PLICRDRAFT_34520 [Plicaturopsis crispa FD-325 SS-3]|nr:hypothetical protein PLICRDRAFT_34520 [Plicaturopsis crispa FD-325 SS-3]
MPVPSDEAAPGDEGQTLEEDETYYLADLFIRVENGLYKVPRRYFETESEFFQEMFGLPVSEGTTPEGSIKDNPLCIEGVKRHDFLQLLRVLHPPHFQREAELSCEEWTSVLELATMWRFQEIRRLAIEKMDTFSMDPIQKLVLAKRLEVTQWILPAIREVAQRAEPIGIDEVNWLGVEWAFKIAAVRESDLASGSHRCSYCGRSTSVYEGRAKEEGRGEKTGVDYDNRIRCVFGL